MGLCFSDLGLALHQNRFIDATDRRSGFLYLGEVEGYLAVQSRKECMIRNTLRGSRRPRELADKIRLMQIACVFIACVQILVEGCLGASNPSKASPAVVALSLIHI